MDSKKTICVVGATGNQGGSVARRFLQDAQYKVRGITRNPSSASALELANLGVEIVAADLDDVKSLEAAFAGANVIFSVTQYWEPFYRPDCREEATGLGISCRRYAYDVERRHGKNITDAAATTLSTLDDNGFLVSTLSNARKCSGGALTELYHFDAKAEVFPDYVRATYPALAAKMSCIQTGFFMTSYRLLPHAYFGKQPDGSFQMQFPTKPDRRIPQFDPVADMGNFTYAVHQMPAGKDYMAMGSYISWSDFIALWAKVTGTSASYKEVTFDEMVAGFADVDTGIEIAHMFVYSSQPGYDGGMDVLTAEDLSKAGIDCPMTSAEEWIKQHDWSAILSQ